MKRIAALFLILLIGVPMIVLGYLWQWVVNGFVTGRKLQQELHRTEDGK